MDLLRAPNTVPLAAADIPPTGLTPGWATAGNPAANVPATEFTAGDYNSMLGEVYNVIVAAGLTPDHSNWFQLLAAIQILIATTGGYSHRQFFLASASWAIPAARVKVRGWAGGGGAGGTGTASNGSPGGGGGGGFFDKITTGLTVGATMPVTIGGAGGGGGGGGAGGSGGTTSFGSYCSATGGSGGGPNPAGNGGSGGVASGGDLNIPGGGGGSGLPAGSAGCGGSGGGSPFGGAGAPGSFGSSNAGTFPGGGGGGPGSGSGNSGGGGAGGLIIVEW